MLGSVISERVSVSYSFYFFIPAIIMDQLITQAKQIHEACQNPPSLSPAQYGELITSLASFYTAALMIQKDKKNLKDQQPVVNNSLNVIRKLLAITKGGVENLEPQSIVIGGVQNFKLGISVRGLYNDLEQKYRLIRADPVPIEAAVIKMTGLTNAELKNAVGWSDDQMIAHIWNQIRYTCQEGGELAIKTKLKAEGKTALEAAKARYVEYHDKEIAKLESVIEATFARCDEIQTPEAFRAEIAKTSELVDRLTNNSVTINSYRTARACLASLPDIEDFSASMVLRPHTELSSDPLEAYYQRALRYREFLEAIEAKHVEYCKLLDTIHKNLFFFDQMTSLDLAEAFTSAYILLDISGRSGLPGPAEAQSLVSRLESVFPTKHQVMRDGLAVDALIKNLTG